MTINVNKPAVSLLITEGEDGSVINTLAWQFGVPIISEVPMHGEPHILMKQGVLQLMVGEGKTVLHSRVDFSRARSTAGKVDPLIRAMGGANRRVLDMTAGWAKDAYHLASNGYWVSALEQHAGIALMLEYARLSVQDTVVAQRLQFYHQDSRQVCSAVIDKLSINFKPLDVVYIDPMFPPKPKRSAAVKKDVVLLQAIVEGFCADNDAVLLEKALLLGASRVVIKRPLRAPTVMGRVPSGSISGKLVRFDIYTPN